MKTALPDNAKIAKEAKECMQECVSEFISFITSEGTSLFAVADSFALWLIWLLACSFREMSAREEENGQRGRYPFCHDLAGIRELLRGPQDLFVTLS